MLKNRELLMEILSDADEFAEFKQIKCPPIYFLGGSACILGGYLERATLDLDFLDIDYSASVGKIFRLFDRFDMLDIYVTPIAVGFEDRAKKIEGFNYLDYYVLSKEDIIVSKLARYSEKDREDIEELICHCDKALLANLIESVATRKNFSDRVRSEFIKNSKDLMERYNV